jgi:geranylgeranylglycerol-phosphate geranylgeranyltransferase
VVIATGAAALLGAALLDLDALPSFVSALTLLALYDVFGKRVAVPFAMDVIQGLGWAVLALWGSEIAGGPSGPTVVLAAYVVVYIAFVNAVHGGLRDLTNDRRHGARTTPVLLGATAEPDGSVGVPPLLLRYAWCSQLALAACAVIGVLAVGGYPALTGAGVALLAALVSTVAFLVLRGAVNGHMTTADASARGRTHIILQLAVALVLVLDRVPWWLVGVALVAYLVPWTVSGRTSATEHARLPILRQRSTALPSPRDVSALVRSAACLAGGGLVFLGAYLGNPGAVGTARIALLAFAIVLVVAYAEALNDIADVAVDTIDKPWRPLPSGRVTVMQAWVVAAVCVCAGVVLAFASGLGFGLTALVLAALSTLYSFAAKGTVLAGNVLVAVLSSTPLVLGAIAAGRITPAVVVAQVIVFLFMLAYEVLKVGKDERGDAAAGLSTLATRFGGRCTSRVFCVIAAAFAAAILLPPVVGIGGGPAYVVAAVFVGVLPMVACSVRISGTARDRWTSAERLLRLAWFPGIASLVLLRV